MKKLVATMLAALMVLTVLVCFPLPASAEALYIRKIVSVVYDDSSSMGSDDNAYANYAMQSFCGMLNSEDQLYITYMSNDLATEKPERIDLSAGAIQKSVDSIRSHTDVGATPYASVEMAFEQLKSVQDSNPNTQYWLVIITDGDFNNSGNSRKEKEDFLNERFDAIAKTPMPNGTYPQINYMTIGTDVVFPTVSSVKVHTAKDAAAIMSTMSEMSDSISGRTRQDAASIKKIDGKTYEFSSTIPLLNIAVFTQGTSAKPVRAMRNGEAEIPLTRQVNLQCPDPSYPTLTGGAYLLGDSQKVIGSGKYTVTFDRDVNPDELIILYEPALEVRVSVTLNGSEITNHQDLKNAQEGDRLSVSYKIYEMDTTTEIDPALLPDKTTFELTVMENGRQVKQVSGAGKELSDYVLHQTDTEVRAAVTIPGFNPIDYSLKFTPTVHVPVYTVTAACEGGDSIKLDDIPGNQSFAVRFTVHSDGVPVTDPNAVKALGPTVSASPNGNKGTVSYEQDGTILFTPNATDASGTDGGFVNVNVTCTLANGASATQSYAIVLSDYEIVAADAPEAVRKTAFFGNGTGVSFYITKDGVKMTKEEIGNDISVSLDEHHEHLLINTTVAPDGTITVVPYSEEERVMNIGNYLSNWWYYWRLSKKDVTVTLTHFVGEAEATLPVRGETGKYLAWYVWVPFVVEVFLVLFLAIWAILIKIKPKYPQNTILYVGDVRSKSSNTSEGLELYDLSNMKAYRLSEFNRIFKKGNGRLCFSTRAKKINLEHGRITIRAERGYAVTVEQPKDVSIYTFKIESRDDNRPFSTATQLYSYASRWSIEVNRHSTVDSAVISGNNKFGPVSSTEQNPKYYVIPNSTNAVKLNKDDVPVVVGGKMFILVRN